MKNTFKYILFIAYVDFFVPIKKKQQKNGREFFFCKMHTMRKRVERMKRKGRQKFNNIK